MFVIHLDGSKDHVVFPILPGTIGSWEEKTTNFSATEDYQLVVVSVVYKKPGGTLWVDDLSLMKNSTTELIQTGSFETVMPLTWMEARNVQVADGRDCAVSRTASCSWALTGNGVEKRIVYHYRPDGLAGDVFDLSIWCTGLSTTGSGYIVLDIFVIHQDGSKQHIVFPILGGAIGSWEQKVTSFTVTENYKLVVFSVVYKKPGGTLWVDDVILSLRD